MRNLFVAVGLIVLLVGLGSGIYLSRQNYIPLLSELTDEIERKNAEIKRLREQEQENAPALYFVKEGKVYKSGSDSAVLKPIELKNGAELRVNGVVVRENGATLRLLEGDLISSEGIILLSSGSAK